MDLIFQFGLQGTIACVAMRLCLYMCVGMSMYMHAGIYMYTDIRMYPYLHCVYACVLKTCTQLSLLVDLVVSGHNEMATLVR